MIAINVTLEVLSWAVDKIGVDAFIDSLNQRETRYRVKLYPLVPSTAWQIDKSRSRKCPKCRQRTKLIEVPDPAAAFLFLPKNKGQLLGECGCEAMPVEWAYGRRWKDERGDAPYQRMSASFYRDERRVHAVCWHGFRDYFRVVFSKAPDAIFRTALDIWRGSEDFEARYRESGYRNIGSQIYPICAAEACRCPESGKAE